MLYHRHVSFRCCSVLLPILCCTPRHRFFFFFKQKTAYEMRISDWSSDVCSSDLTYRIVPAVCGATANRWALACWLRSGTGKRSAAPGSGPRARKTSAAGRRSEEHTSELQSLMRISYAVFCLKKKNKKCSTLQIDITNK